MPQIIMVEAFARGLIDKLMLEAFDVLDTDTDDAQEKLGMVSYREESADMQSAHTRLQIHDQAYVALNGMETANLVEDMVRGLRDVQIGDFSVLPSQQLTILESQVKRVACNIGSAPPEESTDAEETRVTQGQGDVHQIIHDAVIETPNDPSEQLPVARKENYNPTESNGVSISVLHRMIEELETGPEEAQDKVDSAAIEKDQIAQWEEHEEKYIRTIEGTEDADRNNAEESLRAAESMNHPDGLKRNELNSSPTVNEPALLRNVCLEIQEVPSCSNSTPKNVSSGTRVKGSSRKGPRAEKKKRIILARLRKFFRTIFGRTKH